MLMSFFFVNIHQYFLTNTDKVHFIHVDQNYFN